MATACKALLARSPGADRFLKLRDSIGKIRVFYLLIRYGTDELTFGEGESAFCPKVHW